MMPSVNSHISERLSTSINIMKAISVLSVIAAHTVSLSDTNMISRIFSTFWVLFGKIGVIVFFVVGGFLYTRKPNDGKVFTKKKFFRIIVPWFVCSLITYLISAVFNDNLGISAYLKWIFGSGTWYYYITIYTLFIFIFKLVYQKDWILYLFIGIQTTALIMISFDISTTIPLDFFTNFLNPLHWVGYFSLGILIRRYRLDLKMLKNRIFVLASYALAIIFFCILAVNEIFTYFNIITCLFCLSSLIIIADISYKISATKFAKYIGEVGAWSYCIYLLHMQIVQPVVSLIPSSWIKLLLAPLIGLAVMVILISLGLFICKRLPFGDKIKTTVGL